MKKSWFKIENSSDDSATLHIYDEISCYGVTAADFTSELKAITAGTINLRINSPGGDVFDGITIYNALKSHSAKVHVQVDGLAASIASIIAMSGDSINMAKNSFLMVHFAWALTAGNAEELRKLAGTLDKIDGTLVKTYQERTGDSEQDIRNMMAAETWLTADEALGKGFCDTVGDSAEIKARFDLGKFKNTPQAVMGMNIVKPDNERDLEAVLRDAGMSKKEALAAVSSLKIEARRDSEDSSELLEVKTFLKETLLKTKLNASY